MRQSLSDGRKLCGYIIRQQPSSRGLFYGIGAIASLRLNHVVGGCLTFVMMRYPCFLSLLLQPFWHGKGVLDSNVNESSLDRGPNLKQTHMVLVSTSFICYPNNLGLPSRPCSQAVVAACYLQTLGVLVWYTIPKAQFRVAQRSTHFFKCICNACLVEVAAISHREVAMAH